MMFVFSFVILLLFDFDYDKKLFLVYELHTHCVEQMVSLFLGLRIVNELL